MKQVQSYIAALMLVCGVYSASAQQILEGDATISNVKIGKVEDRMFVSMDIIPSGRWNVKSDRAVILTPMIENNDSSVLLPQVRILGRNQYLRHLRNISKDDLGNQIYQAAKTQTIHYEVSLLYDDWMDNSVLILNEDFCGCTQTLLSSNKSLLERYVKPVFNPVFAYVVPKAESVKSRSESGQAYITFHVSKTYIDDTYLNNR